MAVVDLHQRHFIGLHMRDCDVFMFLILIIEYLGTASIIVAFVVAEHDGGHDPQTAKMPASRIARQLNLGQTRRAALMTRPHFLKPRRAHIRITAALPLYQRTYT